MSGREAIRLSGSAAVAAGLVSCMGTFAYLIGVASLHLERVPDTVAQVTWAILLGSFFISDVMEVFALTGTYACQMKQTAYAGLFGYVLSIAGLLGVAAKFLPPLSIVVLMTGLILLALAIQRRGLMKAWPIWLWLAGLIVVTATIEAFPTDGSKVLPALLLSIGINITAAAKIALGAALRRITE